jgi:hypothetical protein
VHPTDFEIVGRGRSDGGSGHCGEFVVVVSCGNVRGRGPNDVVAVNVNVTMQVMMMMMMVVAKSWK